MCQPSVGLKGYQTQGFFWTKGFVYKNPKKSFFFFIPFDLPVVHGKEFKTIFEKVYPVRLDSLPTGPSWAGLEALPTTLWTIVIS